MLRFTDPTAARVGPLAIQRHNKGIQDEYKSLYVQTFDTPGAAGPDDFLTTR